MSQDTTITELNDLISQLRDYTPTDDGSGVVIEPDESVDDVCDVHLFVARKETLDYTPITTTEIERMWDTQESSSTDVWVRNEDGSIHTICSDTTEES